MPDASADLDNCLRREIKQRHSPLKILMVALNYAPEMVGCAKYTSELAEDLVARGHQVTVVTTPPYYPTWKIADGYNGAVWSRENRNGVRIHRTPLYVPNEPTSLKRLVHLASFAVGALPTAVAVAAHHRPDLVFAVAPTLAAATAVLAAGSLFGAKTWMHIQDFEVDAAFDLGIMKGGMPRRIALSVERSLFGRFDRVSSISPAMVQRLSQKGVAQTKLVELRNWVDVDATGVLANSNTSYRQQLGIDAAQIVALYSGNMAAKQGIEALAEVATQLRAVDAPVTMVLCGDGPARRLLEQACSEASNVKFLPLQPLERLPELLGTADIHLLPQRPEAADLVLPSKLTGMLASGRPVVAMAERGTGLAHEIEGAGIATSCTASAMTAAILSLVAAPGLRVKLGASARIRAEERWRKDIIISNFEKKVIELC